MKELRQLGAKISVEESARVKEWIVNRKRHNESKRQRKLERENAALMLDYDSDETFAFIVGYTSGGAPYGITHEQMEEIESSNNDVQMCL